MQEVNENEIRKEQVEQLSRSCKFLIAIIDDIYDYICDDGKSHTWQERALLARESAEKIMMSRKANL